MLIKGSKIFITLRRLAIETHKLFYFYQFPPIVRAYIAPKDSLWVSMEENKREVTDPKWSY